MGGTPSRLVSCFSVSLALLLSLLVPLVLFLAVVGVYASRFDREMFMLISAVSSIGLSAILLAWCMYGGKQ